MYRAYGKACFRKKYILNHDFKLMFSTASDDCRGIPSGSNSPKKDVPTAGGASTDSHVDTTLPTDTPLPISTTFPITTTPPISKTLPILPSVLKSGEPDNSAVRDSSQSYVSPPAVSANYSLGSAAGDGGFLSMLNAPLDPNEVMGGDTLDYDRAPSSGTSAPLSWNPDVFSDNFSFLPLSFGDPTFSEDSGYARSLYNTRNSMTESSTYTGACGSAKSENCGSTSGYTTTPYDPGFPTARSPSQNTSQETSGLSFSNPAPIPAPIPDARSANCLHQTIGDSAPVLETRLPISAHSSETEQGKPSEPTQTPIGKENVPLPELESATGGLDSKSRKRMPNSQPADVPKKRSKKPRSATQEATTAQARRHTAGLMPIDNSTAKKGGRKKHGWDYIPRGNTPESFLDKPLPC